MHNATNISKIITYTACNFPSSKSEEVLWRVGSIDYVVFKNIFLTDGGSEQKQINQGAVGSGV